MKQHNRLFAPIMAIMVILSSCSKESLTLSTDQANTSKTEDAGFVYLESNESKGNTIIIYKQHKDGSLEYYTSVETGGTGTGNDLGSEGSVILNADHSRLFAVNAGSNSISSFELDDQGSLYLKCIVSSGGLMPVSVTEHGNFLYVVNSATANITGFAIKSNGTLTPIPGSAQSLSAANAAPAEIMFKPDGLELAVTEKTTNNITVFQVKNGVAAVGSSYPSHGQTPFGFQFLGSTALVVSNAASEVAGGSSVTSYYDKCGNPHVDGPKTNSQTGSGRLVIATNNYVYITNTGSNTISSYTLDDGGLIELTHAVACVTDKEPTDVVLSGDDQAYLYNINSLSHSITEYSTNADGTLTLIGHIDGLPPHAAGLAAYMESVQ